MKTLLRSPRGTPGAITSVWLLLACPLLLSSCSEPTPPKPSLDQGGCFIDRIVDGDTIAVQCPGGMAGNARLTGFDTPETFRPGCRAEHRAGTRATAYLTHLLETADHIDPTFKGTDRYGRFLLSLRIDGRSLADLMVATGHAVRYSGGKRINWCQSLAQS